MAEGGMPDDFLIELGVSTRMAMDEIETFVVRARDELRKVSVDVGRMMGQTTARRTTGGSHFKALTGIDLEAARRESEQAVRNFNMQMAQFGESKRIAGDPRRMTVFKSDFIPLEGKGGLEAEAERAIKLARKVEQEKIKAAKLRFEEIRSMELAAARERYEATLDPTRNKVFKSDFVPLEGRGGLEDSAAKAVAADRKANDQRVKDAQRRMKEIRSLELAAISERRKMESTLEQEIRRETMRTDQTHEQVTEERQRRVQQMTEIERREFMERRSAAQQLDRQQERAASEREMLLNRGLTHMRKIRDIETRVERAALNENQKAQLLALQQEADFYEQVILGKTDVSRKGMQDRLRHTQDLLRQAEVSSAQGGLHGEGLMGGSKASSRHVMLAFQLQQAVEDATFAGVRGAANNLALVASMMGPKIAFAGLGALTALTLAPLIKDVMGLGEAADKVNERLERQKELLETIRDTRLEVAKAIEVSQLRAEKELTKFFEPAGREKERDQLREAIQRLGRTQGQDTVQDLVQRAVAQQPEDVRKTLVPLTGVGAQIREREKERDAEQDVVDSIRDRLTAIKSLIQAEDKLKQLRKEQAQFRDASTPEIDEDIRQRFKDAIEARKRAELELLPRLEPEEFDRLRNTGFRPDGLSSGPEGVTNRRFKPSEITKFQTEETERFHQMGVRVTALNEQISGLKDISVDDLSKELLNAAMNSDEALDALSRLAQGVPDFQKKIDEQRQILEGINNLESFRDRQKLKGLEPEARQLELLRAQREELSEQFEREKEKQLAGVKTEEQRKAALEVLRNETKELERQDNVLLEQQKRLEAQAEVRKEIERGAKEAQQVAERELALAERLTQEKEKQIEREQAKQQEIARSAQATEDSFESSAFGVVRGNVSRFTNMAAEEAKARDALIMRNLGAPRELIEMRARQIEAFYERVARARDAALLERRGSFLTQQASAAGEAGDFDRQRRLLQELQGLQLGEAGRSMDPGRVQAAFQAAQRTQQQILATFAAEKKASQEQVGNLQAAQAETEKLLGNIQGVVAEASKLDLEQGNLGKLQALQQQVAALSMQLQKLGADVPKNLLGDLEAQIQRINQAQIQAQLGALPQGGIGPAPAPRQQQRPPNGPLEEIMRQQFGPFHEPASMAVRSLLGMQFETGGKVPRFEVGGKIPPHGGRFHFAEQQFRKHGAPMFSEGGMTESSPFSDDLRPVFAPRSLLPKFADGGRVDPFDQPERFATGGLVKPEKFDPSSVERMNIGGFVPGPRGAGDIVPALLTPGEVVLNFQQQARLGSMFRQPSSNVFRAIGVPGFGQGGVPDKKQPKTAELFEQIHAPKFEMGGAVESAERLKALGVPGFADGGLVLEDPALRRERPVRPYDPDYEDFARANNARPMITTVPRPRLDDVVTPQQSSLPPSMAPQQPIPREQVSAEFSQRLSQLQRMMSDESDFRPLVDVAKGLGALSSEFGGPEVNIERFAAMPPLERRREIDRFVRMLKGQAHRVRPQPLKMLPELERIEAPQFAMANPLDVLEQASPTPSVPMPDLGAMLPNPILGADQPGMLDDLGVAPNLAQKFAPQQTTEQIIARIQAQLKANTGIGREAQLQNALAHQQHALSLQQQAAKAADISPEQMLANRKSHFEAIARQRMQMAGMPQGPTAFQQARAFQNQLMGNFGGFGQALPWGGASPFGGVSPFGGMPYMLSQQPMVPFARGGRVPDHLTRNILGEFQDVGEGVFFEGNYHPEHVEGIALEVQRRAEMARAYQQNQMAMREQKMQVLQGSKYSTRTAKFKDSDFRPLNLPDFGQLATEQLLGRRFNEQFLAGGEGSLFGDVSLPEIPDVGRPDPRAPMYEINRRRRERGAAPFQGRSMMEINARRRERGVESLPSFAMGKEIVKPQPDIVGGMEVFQAHSVAPQRMNTGGIARSIRNESNSSTNIGNLTLQVQDMREAMDPVAVVKKYQKAAALRQGF